MKIRTHRALAWLTLLSLAVASPALAGHHEGKEDKKGHAGHEMSGQQPEGMADKAKGPSPEKRAKMAAAHERMAACLRSTRPIQECHSEMKSACKESGGHCGMGGHGMSGHDKSAVKPKPE
jgi:hypothetical protein